MKYFTKKRFEQLNSPDPRRMVAAARVWDQAIADYRSRLQVIKPRLPEGASHLASDYCFHDAQLLTFSTSGEDEFAVLLRDRSLLYLVSYRLAGEPKLSAATMSATYSPQGVVWLYDEFDVTGTDRTVHRILFSDGSELILPFSEVRVTEFEIRLQTARNGDGKRAKSKGKMNTTATLGKCGDLSVLDHLKPLHPIAGAR